MKHKAIVLAVIAATMSAQSAHAATALEYSVQAQLPRGESMSGAVHIGDRSRGPLIDALNASNAVAQAGAVGKHTVQIRFGREQTCVTLSVVTQGSTVTATGTASLPPPPPQDRKHDDGAQPPPPPRDASVSVRIVAMLDGQQLRSARGDIGPPNNAHGPHMAWTLERVNH